MKIGMVCYPTYGGSGVVATELGKGLARKEHEVHFISYQQPVRLDSFQTNVYYHDVNLFDYPLFQYPPYETALASKLVDVVLYEKLDILHVHYAIPHAVVAYTAKKILLEQGIYIPVVTTLHGTDITLVGNNESFAPVVTFSINKSDAVTAVSESLKNDTNRLFNIKQPIEVIPNFIDFDRFKKLDKDHFKKAIAPHGEKLLVHTSNFRKVKRVEDVVCVFNEVIKHIPSKLILVGDGPERQHLETICRQKGLSNHVLFLGKQQAVEEILAIADLFLIPSESESFGLAALEAMACEVPVISSNAGGLPEVNIHAQTGFMSAVGDTTDMAKNALFILQDEQVLATFRKNALEQARRFDIHHILPAYEQLYLQTIQKAHKK
jgi:N-acetyl-alpha-D-glucosaminyl L-malate synthase BshA